jgi:hypothetical protein
MSNNKQIMKLYTEEQVKEILKSTHIHTDNDVDMILPQFTPIELPTDEEIFNQAILAMEEMYGSGCDAEIDAYFRGAKWMQNLLKQ